MTNNIHNLNINYIMHIIHNKYELDIHIKIVFFCFTRYWLKLQEGRGVKCILGLISL